MTFFTRYNRLHPLSRYIAACCAQLACLMLAGALITLVWAGQWDLYASLQYEYASYTSLSACAVLFAGLFGGLLLEDILQKTA